MSSSQGSMKMGEGNGGYQEINPNNLDISLTSASSGDYDEFDQNSNKRTQRYDEYRQNTLEMASTMTPIEEES